MSLAKLAASGGSGAHVAPAYVALAAVLALLGLALLIFVQAVSPPGVLFCFSSWQQTLEGNAASAGEVEALVFRVLRLLVRRMLAVCLCLLCAHCAGPSRVMGVLAVLMYGIVVLLSTLYPNMSSMWVNSVLLVVAGMVVAAAISILIGFLVAPSLASDEVGLYECLQGRGQQRCWITPIAGRVCLQPAVAGVKVLRCMLQDAWQRRHLNFYQTVPRVAVPCRVMLCTTLSGVAVDVRGAAGRWGCAQLPHLAAHGGRTSSWRSTTAGQQRQQGSASTSCSGAQHSKRRCS